MYRLLALIIIVLECFQLSAQINDEEENNNFSHSISIGWSNPVSSISTLFDAKFEEKIGVLIDYQMSVSENKFYKIHTKFSPSYKNPTFSLNNFLISITKGSWLMEKRNINIGHGIGPYFRCNIYRGQSGRGTQVFWSSDDFGVGIEYFVFLDYLVKKDFFITLIANLNIGLHQYYEATIGNGSAGNATLSQEYWGIKLANQQLISVAIKKYL